MVFWYVTGLPFQNQSNDPDQDYFVDGITEDIINNLSLWRTFPVTSSNSSFMYKNKSINVKDVGNELGVRYVVQGSVRKGGQKVRITAQLIEAPFLVDNPNAFVPLAPVAGVLAAAAAGAAHAAARERSRISPQSASVTSRAHTACNLAVPFSGS